MVPAVMDVPGLPALKRRASELDGHCRVERELQTRFGRQLQMFGALAGDDRSGCRPGCRANRGAGAAARDAADNRAEPRAAGDLARRLLAFARSLRFDLGCDDVVLAAAERDGVRFQRDLV